MRQTSALYKTLRNEVGSYYEVEVTNNGSGQTYTAADLKTVKITPLLLNNKGFSIGNTCSAQCKISLIEASSNWPRMSEFTVRVRLSSADDEWKSEWLNMGTFYTDERSDDKYGNLEIIGFDKMLVLEAPWYTNVPEEDIPASWPITARAMVNLLKDAFGFTVDNIDNVDNSHAFIGLDTTATAREMMSIAAAGCGGNWIVTPDNRFRLVPFVNGGYSSENSAIAGIAIAGNAVVGVTSTGGINGYSFYGETDIVLSAMDFNFSPVFAAVSGVTFTAEDGTVDTYGDDSGYVISQELEFSRSGTAKLALGRVAGYTYRPFEARTAIVDPAVELGDILIFNENAYQIAAIEWNVSPHITADLSAPYDPEIDHEYPYLDQAERAYKKTQQLKNEYEEAYSEIVQEIGQINLEVAQKVGDDEIISRINLSPETITIDANRVNITGFVTFSDLSTPGQSTISGSNIRSGTITLGGSNNINGTMTVLDSQGNQTTLLDYNGINTKSLTAAEYIRIDNTSNYGTSYNTLLKLRLWEASSYLEISPSHPFYLYSGTSGLNGYWTAEIEPSGQLYIRSGQTGTYCVVRYSGVLSHVDTSEGISGGFRVEGGSRYFDAAYTGYQTNGTKSRAIEDDQIGKISFYCYETPTPMFGDIGEGVLDSDGVCVIELDPALAFGITAKGYQVFLQKYGQGDCWVSERKPGYFAVEGTPNLKFGWELKARQADYDQVRYNNPNEEIASRESQSETLAGVFETMKDIIERSIAS